jgi:YfiH family protein
VTEVERGGLALLRPEWPAPPNVQAWVTTRRGGVSRPPFTTLNLGDHVGDAPAAVAENRRWLAAALALPAAPRWLMQVHGRTVVAADRAADGCEADAAYSRGAAGVCAVLTADCLPVLFCDRGGTVVAAAHAGWRGLADGVLEATAARMGAAPADLLAWLGPAIGPDHFEVGDEVRAAFVAVDRGAADAFVPTRPGRWLADLYALARRRLAAVGVGQVFGGGLCTACDPERFYSFRRDGRTGRMASLIWLEGAARR